MFEFLNASIFNRSMPADHQCIELNCTGSKMHGLSLTCPNCLKPFFFECLAKRTEITELLKLLEIDKLNSSTSVSTVKSTLDKLFGRDSVFVFICPSCKNSDLNDVICSKYEPQIEELKNKAKSEKARATRAENKTKQLQQQINELQSSNNTDKPTIEEIDSNRIISDLRSRIATLEAVVSDVQIMLSTHSSHNVSVLDLFDQCKTEMLAKNKVFEDIMNAFQGIPSSSSSTAYDVQNDAKPAHQSTPETVNLIDSPINSNQSKFRSSEINGPSKKRNSPKSNANIPSKSSVLKPPLARNPIDSRKADSKSVYEIYVSKFDTSVTCDNIASHIIDNTPINSNDSFNVTPLITTQEELERKNYIAFKITTLKREIYEMILNKTIWSPHYEAKMFYDKSKRGNGAKNVKFEEKKFATPSKPKRNSPRSYKYGDFNDRSNLRSRNRIGSSNKSSFSGNSSTDNNEYQQAPNNQFTFVPFIQTPNPHQLSYNNQNFLYSHNIPQPPIIRHTVPLQHQDFPQQQQQQPHLMTPYQPTQSNIQFNQTPQSK